MSRNGSEADRAASPRRRRRWPWFGLGVLGAVGLGVLLGTARSRTDGPSRPRRSGDDGTAADESRASADPFALPASVTESWVPGPDGSLRMVECHPEADVGLLFVHGLGGRLEHWAGQLACLGPGLAGLALDLPGHGGSDGFGDHDALESAAGAIGAVLTAGGQSGRGLRRPLIVAHAWGCLAALRWAARHPGQARGLLLLDPPADQSQMAATDVDAFTRAIREDARGELGFFLRQSLADVPGIIADGIVADVESTPDSVLEACLLESSGATPARDAGAARIPVHVASSDLGRLPQSIEALVPSVTAWRLPGDSHWAMLSRPDPLNQLIDDVLDSLRTQPE